jgi:O-antigen ligase
VKAATAALAAFFTLVQFYTSLAPLSPTPPVGYVFASRPGAALLAGLLVAAALVLGIGLLREGAPPAQPSFAILCAWIGAAALASALGLDPVSGFAVVGVMLLTAVFHLALVRFAGRPGVMRAVLTTYLWAGLGASLAALAMLAARRPAPLWVLNHGRAAGFFVTANQFGAFLIAFVFIALGAALAGDVGLRRLGAAGVGVGACALLATVSLGALLGAAVAGAFFCFALGARRAAAALSVALAAAAALVALGPAIRHNPAESLDRLRIWQGGVRVVELFPLTGAGPMAYFRVYPAVRPPNGDPPGTFGALHPHDAYLSLAGETGVVGLVAAIYGWTQFTRAFRARVRRLEPRDRRFALATAAALVAVLVQGLFDQVGVVELAFVWIAFTGLALAAANDGLKLGRRGPPLGGGARRAPFGGGARRVAGVLLLTSGLGGCAAHGAGGGASPAPSLSPAPTARPPGPTAPPVNFSGRRVGSHYVYATEQRGAHKLYVLRADAIDAVYSGAATGRSDLTNPHVVFYGTGGKRLAAAAPAGTVVEKDKTMLMTGGVHARSQDGMTLTSDALRYDERSQTVHGSGNVVVTFPAGETLRGQTMDWNLQNGHITVAGAP